MEIDEKSDNDGVTVDEEQLLQTVDLILESSNLDSLKIAQLRRQCEEKLNLPANCLDNKPYKKKIRRKIDEYLARLEENEAKKEEKQEYDMLDRHLMENEKRREKEKEKYKNNNNNNGNSNESILDIPSNLKSNYHIYESNGIKHCIMLNQTDIAFGERGHNKFYGLQLLENNDNNYYKFICKWGRVGHKGQMSEFEYDNLSIALNEFCKKFKSKTKNEWGTKKFIPHNNKYIPIDINIGSNNNTQNNSDFEYNSENSENNNNNNNNNNNSNNNIDYDNETIASRLDGKLIRMLKLIFDRQLALDTLKTFEIDINRSPLGTLTKKQIERGYKILDLINNELLNAYNNKDNLDKGRYKYISKLNKYTSQFYTLIPHNFGFKKPPIIDSLKKLHKKIELLQSLNDMNITNSILKDNNNRSRNMNIIDSHYNALHCTIDTLNYTDIEYINIKKSILNTHGNTHNEYTLDILDIFKVSRNGEKFRHLPFAKTEIFLPNNGGNDGNNNNNNNDNNESMIDSNSKLMLWHGSRLSNFVGILSQGLRIAPPEAPSTGYMFGKGIYFADCASKSANYINATNDHPYGLLILSKVFVGKTHNVYKAKYMNKAPIGYHSVKGCGKMIPSVSQENEYIFDNGYKLYLGPLTQNNDENVSKNGNKLQYNEYIVYDIAQVEIKYLALVHFNFND